MADKERLAQSQQETSSLGSKHASLRPTTPEKELHTEMAASSPASASTIPSLSDRASRLTVGDENVGANEHQEHPYGQEAPPPYSEELGRIFEDGEHVGTNAAVAKDGRVNINIDQHTRRLSTLLAPALRTHQHGEEPPPPYIPPSLGGSPDQVPPPSMNVVIHVVGSRGDVQPFVALGKVLKDTYGHRVRLATHPTFKELVEENGLEFFSIGGDPSELMAFMVKNPGLMPGFDSLRNGDIGARRKSIAEMIRGCWRSCFEAGDGTGVAVTDGTVNEWMKTNDPKQMSQEAAAAAASKPFVADCIIANPPSFAHVHCAERLGIPLHIMFTMPWSPTQAFPHPLANVQSSNADVSMTNYITYTLIEMLTWQGLGDVINQFRLHSLGLEPISLFWAPGILNRLKVPHTYCWSPAVIPKPADWPPHISVSGFFFLSLASNYTPQPELKAFLDAGPPPVYIGFGSIVVDDPNAMTKMIFEAVEKTGQRALVSKGWGGLGAGDLGIPEGVFMLGNVPHDWLFQHVSCVVHHGGAGTTAAGIACGKPTVIVPFFGDQPFWGAMVAKAGAGPVPIPHKDLTTDKLADAINFALKPSSLERAKELAQKISREDGNQKGAQSFHQMLDIENMRCSIIKSRPAVWRVKRTQIKLCALAAYSLASQGAISYDDLKLYRPKEWEADMGPPDPVTGVTSALIGIAGSAVGGVADLPIGTLKALGIHPDAAKKKKEKQEAEQQQKAEDTQRPALTHSSSSAMSSASRSLQTQPSGLELVAGTVELSGEPSTPAKLQNDDASSAADTSMTNTSSSTRLEPTTSITSSDSRPTMTGMSTEGGERSKPESLLTVPGTDGDRGRESPMTDALHSLSDSSRPHSPSGSRSPKRPSSSQGEQKRRKSSVSSHAAQYAPDPLDTIYGTGKGISKIVGAGLKSPLEFTMAVSKGFHNVPRLYGEEPRQVDRVTGMHSGIRTAGKEFGIGLFDGITGLFTQPVQGARKEGASGFLKGVGRGIAGIVVKPSAAAYALPAYAMMGVYKEIQKRLGENVGSYIIAARVAQGYGEWLGAEEAQRRDIVHAWAECLSEVKGRRGLGKKKDHGGGMPAIKEFVEKRKEKRKFKHIKGKEGVAYEAAVSALSAEQSEAATPEVQPRELLAPAVEDDDAELEEAIRLSLKVDEPEAQDDSDAETKKAIAKSLEQMKQVDEDHEEEQLRRAIAESMRQHGQEVHPESSRTVGHHDEHDEELRKALEESKRHGEEDEKRRQREEELVLEYVRKQSLAEDEFRRMRTNAG